MFKSDKRVRVLALAGNARQQSASARVSGLHVTSGGSTFSLDWNPAGFEPTHRVLALVERAIDAADILLVSPRLGTIIRRHAIAYARRHGVVVVQLVGSGTGQTGVLRAAGEAADDFLRIRRQA